MHACVPLLLAMLAVASAVHIDDSLDDRLNSLDARVTALALNGNDAPDALVKKFSNNRFESCKEVAAMGLCEKSLAKTGCSQSCTSGEVDTKRVGMVTAEKGTDTVFGKKSDGKFCSFHGDCESDNCYKNVCLAEGNCRSTLTGKCPGEECVGEGDRANGETIGPNDDLCQSKTCVQHGVKGEKTYRCQVKDECYDGNGEYFGDVAETETGRPCMDWRANAPHKHDNHGAGPENFCRNPDGEPRPWCYTQELKPRWEYCDINKC